MAPKRKADIASDPTPPTAVQSVKAFDKGYSCRGFKFELGKTYTVTGSVKACENGFHACENPWDVLNYYPLATSVFAEVEQSGELDRYGDDSKIASASITIKAELSLPAFIKRAAAWVVANAKTALATGDSGHAAATGDRGHAAATGYRGHAAATGDRGHAAATGEYGIAVAIGYGARAKAGPKGAICITCISQNDFKTILAINASKVGENGIKPDVWYRLNEKGEFVEDVA